MIKKGIDPVTHKGLNSGTDKPENLPEKQNVNQTTSHDDDDLDNEKTKKNNKTSGLSSARFLNRVANRFGKRINHSVLSEIIGSGGPLTTTSYTTTTTTTSVSVDSDQDKSTSSSFTPTSNILCQVAVATSPVSSNFDDGNVNLTSSSSTFSDSSVNNPLIMYCDNFVGNYNIDDEDTIGFSTFLNDEDFKMLEESCVENNAFMKELTRFLHEDENDVIEVTPVYERQDIFHEIDNYFG